MQSIEPVMTTDSNPPVRTNWVYMQPIQITGQIYSDQTGRFPLTSSRGNKYIMILDNFDSNAILAEAIKSRSDHEMICAYKTLHTYLTTCGRQPKLQRLDNEASTELKDLMRKKQVNFQLTPPHCHRRNAAKRAICRWKNHFIAGLASNNKRFPIHLWDRLIPQAVKLAPSPTNSRLMETYLAPHPICPRG